MGCTQSNKDESYNFYDNIETYLNAIKSSENGDTQQKVSTECSSMSTAFYNRKNPKVAKSICEKFLKLYISLNEPLSKGKNDATYLSAVNFLNYWLNAELKKKLFKENIDVNDFYDNLETYAQSIDAISFLNIKEICVIKNDELNNMNILYNIYSNYYNVYNESDIVCNTKATCIDYSKKCVQDYKKLIIKCPQIQSDFCKAIDMFKNKYESLNKSTKSNGDFHSKDLISLPSYQEALEEYQSQLYRKKITIATISIICSIFGIILILFYLYKFTPFGKWLPINKKNQEKRHLIKEKMYNYIDNSNEYSTYNEYTPYRFGYNST
ncbi:PIR protein [Plasmodium vivax]|nr:PIR protein [Plasmodium vivax]